MITQISATKHGGSAKNSGGKAGHLCNPCLRQAGKWHLLEARNLCNQAKVIKEVINGKI